MHRSNIIGVTIACLLIATLGVTANAGTHIYDFSDGTLGGLTISANTGFSVSVGGGVATVSSTAGTGNGSVNLATPYSVIGDFDVSVEANRLSLGNAELGISAGTSSTLANLFCLSTNTIASNVFRPSIFTAFQDPNSEASINLDIKRQGDTLTETYSDGGSVSVSHSETDPSFAGPLPIQLFMIEEFGNSSAHSGSFGEFSVTASNVPEPASLGLLGAAALWLSGRRTKKNFV